MKWILLMSPTSHCQGRVRSWYFAVFARMRGVYLFVMIICTYRENIECFNKSSWLGQLCDAFVKVFLFKCTYFQAVKKMNRYKMFFFVFTTMFHISPWGIWRLPLNLGNFLDHVTLRKVVIVRGVFAFNKWYLNSILTIVMVRDVFSLEEGPYLNFIETVKCPYFCL